METVIREPVLGYLVGTFPSITETFILREILSLRNRGFRVEVFAMKRPVGQDVERSLLWTGAVQDAVYARPGNFIRYLITNLGALLRSPLKYGRTLRMFFRSAWDQSPRDWYRILYHFYGGIGFMGEYGRRGVQHLHAHFTSGCDAALAAHLVGGWPFSFTAHASGDIYMRPVLLNEKIRHASFIIPVCAYNAAYLDGVSGYRHREKYRVIHNSVDLEEPSRLTGGYGRAPRERKGGARVLSVGSLIRMKGHATLILACAVLQRAGYDVRCKIIGGGPERETLHRLIDAESLHEVVDLAGPRSLSEVYLAMAEADLFALLSQVDVDGYRDGFPTVILEAMVMELPVVSTWVSGIPELVADGESGFLVPERDPEAAAVAIGRLLDDRELRAIMGRAGRRRVAERFDFDTAADERAELFRVALSGSESSACCVAASHRARPDGERDREPVV